MNDTWLVRWSGAGDWQSVVVGALAEVEPAHPCARHVLSREVGGKGWNLLLEAYTDAECRRVVDLLSGLWDTGMVGAVAAPEPPGPELHPLAATGFGAAAEAYERGRPDYPSAAIAALVERLGIGPGKVVVDLAAGTGKLTRDLISAGAEVIAVEPIDAMAAVLARAVPTARLLRGTAEAIPLPDDSVDAVTVAQAFHWFEATRAATEMRRVLRPGGAVAALWNTRRTDLEPWARVERITGPYRGRSPHYREDDSWQSALTAAGFGPIEATTFDHVQVVDAATFVDRVMSTSYMGSLADGEAAMARAQLGSLVATTAPVRLHYLTEVFVAVLEDDR
jgi:SAM-dependent methyltransferase